MKNLHLISAIQQAQVSDQWSNINVNVDLNDQELHALGVEVADMLGYVPISAEVRWSDLLRSVIFNFSGPFQRGCLCRQVASYIDSHESWFITKDESRDLWTSFFGSSHEDVGHCPTSWRIGFDLESDFDRFLDYASTFPEIGSLDDPTAREEIDQSEILRLHRFVCFLLRWDHLPSWQTQASKSWALYFQLNKWANSLSHTPTYREYACEFLSAYQKHANASTTGRVTLKSKKKRDGE